MKAINYIYIPVAELYMEVSKTDPAETKDWMLGVLTSVIKQERGVYELADRIIDEADAVLIGGSYDYTVGGSDGAGVETIMRISRNILHSLRIAGTEEAQ